MSNPEQSGILEWGYVLLVLGIFLGFGGIVLSSISTNSSSSTQKTIQGDVVIVHQAGTYTVYNAITNTDAGRGIALIAAMANTIAGDSVYLKAENYDMLANGITLRNAAGINLYGSGKHATIIKSSIESNTIIQLGLNDVVSDLAIYSTDAYTGTQVDFPIGSSITAAYGNDILRNLYIQGYTDGIYLQSSSAGIANAIYAYNITSNTMYDAEENKLGAPVYIFDSNFTVNSIIPDIAGQARAINDQQGNVIVVNTLMRAYNGISETAGLATHNAASVATIYGGNIIVPTTANTYSLENAQGFIQINSSLSYNSMQTSGTINSIAGGYGAYSYQKSPVAQPIIGSSTPNNTIMITQTGFSSFASDLSYMAIGIVAVSIIMILLNGINQIGKGGRGGQI